jgi:hypothetical protein
LLAVSPEEDLEYRLRTGRGRVEASPLEELDLFASYGIQERKGRKPLALGFGSPGHWYEAILATFSILIWHLYAVVFDPEVYPMDPSWITGRTSAEHLRRTRPAYSAELTGETPAGREGEPGMGGGAGAGAGPGAPGG